VTRIAVVVLARDEARELPALLDHLATLPGAWEVVLADGGSSDGTPAIARARGVPVVTDRGGRAAQANAGAQATTGDPVVFLHADSRLPPGAHDALRRAAHDPAVAGGSFALRFAGRGWFPRGLGAVYALQQRAGFWYGDATIWCRRAAFDALGGFAELPVMDDYDFVRRLRAAGRTARLPGPATTSVRRWERMGVARTLVSWWVIRWLYLAGANPHALARLYRAVR
jgi:rSAM/selenodomain-associated transferase 2